MNIATRLKRLGTSCSGHAMSSASNSPSSKENNRKKNDAAEPRETAGIIFESLEPRLLLSADFLPVHGSIDTPGETDKFTFHLAEHTQLYFDSLENSDLTWSLTGPSGSEGTDRPFSDSEASASRSTLLDLVAGDYTLTVGGSADATGSYDFRLLDLAAANPITSGQLVEGNLATGRETLLYRFDAAAGERFFFDWRNGTNAANWRLIDPFGKDVWSQ
ncbi:LEPR-XLL domain-containing protein, partial [Rhizobium leguminosarum]|uniref:LEPR-XLL domain-containing protein n=1 Tax=Rhizobium ruizarguesonis TaxID=2081791 RepID=UPI0013DE954A